MLESGKFIIPIDGTDWYVLSKEQEIDVSTHDAIVERIAEGFGTTEVAKHVIVEQEVMGETVLIACKSALLMGTGAAVARLVSQQKTETEVDGRTVRHREFVAESQGRPPLIFTESEFEGDEETEVGIYETIKYLPVTPNNEDVVKKCRDSLKHFVMGNIRNRLTEIHVSGGLDAMKQAATELKAEIDAAVEALNGTTNLV